VKHNFCLELTRKAVKSAKNRWKLDYFYNILNISREFLPSIFEQSFNSAIFFIVYFEKILNKIFKKSFY